MNKSIVRRIRKIERKNSPEKIIMVHMWTPDEKDGATEGGRIQIKASNRSEHLE
jgi:hypothetical protein